MREGPKAPRRSAQAVENAEGVAAMVQRDLEYPAVHALERLRRVGLTVLPRWGSRRLAPFHRPHPEAPVAAGNGPRRMLQ
jgi:hypothetical protein